MVDITRPSMLVIARNPWLGGKLLSAAKEAGVNVKKALYFRNPPPWSKFRNYRKGASEKQLQVWSRFERVAKETAGMPIAERIKRIRQALKKPETVVA